MLVAHNTLLEISCTGSFLALCMLGKFNVFWTSADFFQINFLKKYFRNNIRMSNSLGFRMVFGMLGFYEVQGVRHASEGTSSEGISKSAI